MLSSGQSLCRVLASVAGLVAAASSLRAQESPFLPASTYQLLVNEISGDIAFEHIRYFTHFHRPMGGSKGFEAVARYVEEKAKEYGLEDVRFIRQPYSGRTWNQKYGELWLIEPEGRRLAFTPEVALSLADYSRPADVASADLVDVGDGGTAGDYQDRNVKGRVVLASGSLGKVMEEAVWQRGALGVVWFPTARMPDHPDQVPWTRIPVESEDKQHQGTFAFVLSNREGMRLRGQMAAWRNRPVRVRAKVDSEFVDPSWQAIVEATIRGTDLHDQDIVLTGHLQEERFSANDDGSGSANTLEIARALKKLIDEHKLPRPRRDIRFWWVNEISAEYQYFSDHPEERRQLLVDLNEDMVGAKLSAGSRVQFVTRTPFSRPSVLSDVTESILTSLVEGNTSYLAAGQARQLARGIEQPAASSGEQVPYSKPILSRLGTAERYDARLIPFHNNTDHQVFNDGIIGVPALTFTNWPDEYIHSTDDDLWQIDPTELKRNGVAVAAIAWYLANAGERDGPALCAEVWGRAHSRLGHELRVAMDMLADAGAERADAYKRARNQVHQAVGREARTIDAIRPLLPPGSGWQKQIGEMSGAITASESQRYVPDLDRFYLALGGETSVPALTRTAKEKALAAKVPKNVDSVKAYLEGRGKMKAVRGLHALMAYEILNFVDGRNSYLDVYNAVSAEAVSAGAWYYGTITPEQVEEHLDNAAKAGIITVHGAATGSEGGQEIR